MKIAVATNDQDIKGVISPNFGRAQYFLIIDDKTKEYRIVENPGAVCQGGAGIKAAQKIIDEKVEGIIAFQLGENAGNLFKVAGVEIKKPTNDNIDTQIEAYSTLPAIEGFHEGFHGGQ